MNLRPISQHDNLQVAALIRTVMTEQGASGAGFAIHDPEVADMYSSYQQTGSRYYVIEENEKILGAGGYAPLIGGDVTTCELRKMYFYPELRGQGFGTKLLEKILIEAALVGYKNCYLETLSSMKSAIKLYEKSGFQRLDGPLGKTGHFACNHWYIKKI